MTKVKAILGYVLASLSVPIVLVALIGTPFWTELMVSATGVTVSPWFTGGEVVRSIDHGAYQTHIHRPVFDALIGERREGFVQVDWAPRGALPARLDEEVDLDGDGQADFRVEFETQAQQVTLTPYARHVVALEGSYQLEDAWVIRVTLENPSR